MSKCPSSLVKGIIEEIMKKVNRIKEKKGKKEEGKKSFNRYFKSIALWCKIY
jgi:hypothetical protein